MKGLVSAAILSLVVVTLAAEEIKLGAGVTLKEGTPIASLVSSPDQFVGKTVRVDGVGTAVCEMMGCWIAIAESDSKDAKTIRVKVDDGVIKIPVTAKGKKVSAEGVFEAAGDEHAKEAAAEHAKQSGHAATVAAKVYQIKGTGVVIR